MRNIILITPKNIHFDGKKSNVESDVFYHFEKSLKSLNKKILVAKFKNNKNNYQELDLNYLKKKMMKKSLILIDANISTEDNRIYPLGLYKILKDSNSKVVCFVPDLIKTLNFKNWVNVSNLIIAFSKDAVNWANKYYKTNKFHFYPSLPLFMSKTVSYKNFIKRPYDIGYIGSDKKFRSKFLNNLKNKILKKNKILIINSNRSLKKYNSTKSYLKKLSQCKFYFCTRASVFENYSTNFFNIDLKEGRYANRVSEAIICGSIPLYWQTKFNNSLLGLIQKKIFFSRKKIVPTSWGMKGNTASYPYDNMDIKLKKGIEVVKDVDEAVIKVNKYNSKYINEKLNYGLKIYNNYISPKAFYNFIEKKIK